MTNALQMLREDHKRVKDLFKQFEEAGSGHAKAAIVTETLTELEIHAELEEEIFYPAVRKEADAEEDQMDEAEEEHHVVKLLIAELRRMAPSAARYDAKFTVLSENVKHHIDEEESEMLPKAAELGTERMNELGAEMEQRKLQLTSEPAGSKPSARRAAKPVNTRLVTRRATTRTEQKAIRTGTAVKSKAAATRAATARSTRKPARARGHR